VFRAELWWTAALIATGMVGGAVYNWPAAVSDRAVDEVADQPQDALKTSQQSQGFSLTGQLPAAPTNDSAPIELDSLRVGDRLLSGGNFIGAYQQYLKLQKQAGAAEDGSLSVRLGLAAELAGFLNQAEQHYRAAIDSPASSLLQQLWGLIGTARLWEAGGRLDEAIGLLSELFLVYGSDHFPDQIRLPIYGQLSQCLQKRTLADAGKDMNTLPAVVRYHWVEPDIESVISDAVELSATQLDAAETAKLEVIQKPINDVSLILVDAQIGFRSLPQLISDVAQAAGLDLQISSHARSLLSERSLRIDSKALPVSVLLDEAFGSLPLAWRQTEGTVYVLHVDELTSVQKQTYPIERIQRLLRQWQLNFGEGAPHVAALMHDANNCLLLGDTESAANKYQAARDLRPGGELSALLYFNVGILELSQDRQESALGKFYQSLDQTLSPQLQASSYARIAGLELELGRPAKAIPAAARGRRLSQDPRVAPINLMLLAKSYLLESDPFSANQVLFDDSALLITQSNRRLAGVMASYARFQVARPAGGLQHEGERLVVSLAALHPDDAQDFVDHFILARAFADVGFRTKAIEHLQAAAATASGRYWQNRIQVQLAEIFYQAGDLDQAAVTLQNIVQSSDGAVDVQVQLLRARISLQLQRSETCLSLCQSLLRQSLDEATKKQTLELLGKAYQQTGQHYSAALCFAGLLPETATAERTEELNSTSEAL
jgi:tetratricopeptide (TPR) repeat protein